MFKLILVICIFFIISLNANEEQEEQEARKVSSYYSMITYVRLGKNLFELLDLDQYNFDPSTLKKAFYKKAQLYHPDKNKEESAVQMYLDIQFAYEILGEDNTRAQYLSLLENGIPWQDEYVGRHYHRFVTQRKITMRQLIIGFFVIMTAGKHGYLWHRYNVVTKAFKGTNYYKRKKNEHKEMTGDELEVDYAGRMPTWKDLFLWDIPKFIYYSAVAIVTTVRMCFGYKPKQKTIKEICEEHNITEEKYHEIVEKRQRKYEKLKGSNKMKRYLRAKKARINLKFFK
jgi:curved DNA-binding protein CbpA